MEQMSIILYLVQALFVLLQKEKTTPKVVLKEEKSTKEESKVTELTTCYMYIQILLC